MITIYEKNAQDFSTLGLGTLEPVLCEIEEQAGGLYELVLRQPITDDNRAFLLAADRIIKAPAPMRETPQITIDGASGESVTREIWQVNTGNSRLHLRAKPNGKIIGAYPSGTKVVKYGESSVAGWWGVIVCEGGAKGYMYADYLKYVGTETEVIRGDTPGTVVQPRQTREQLFRIYSVVSDSEGRFVEAKARHISYDLMGAVIPGAYAVENVSAQAVCAQLLLRADHDCGVSMICGVDGPVSGDFGGKNLLEAILDPETGIAAQTGAKVIRDNFEIFLVPDEERDRGVEIRYGKNLLSAQLEQDMSDVVTRIVPVGKDREGEDLYGAPVDSVHIGEYPVIRTAVVEYDVKEGKDLSRSQALELLAQKAREDFDAGCDLPAARLDAKFVRLELSEEYTHLANEYALHLYDSVPVIDHGAGIDVKVRMVGYTFDALMGKYDETRLGELSEIAATVHGYELANGSIGGTKIANGTITGGKLRDLSVGYAKITAAAIEQLSADAVVAIRADIRKLVAGSITADQLYADLASIAKAQITAANIESANIEWAQIETLAAQIALVAQAEIAQAEIDWAQIKNAKIDTADIENLEAVIAGITKAEISRAEIDGAQIKNASIDSAKIALGAITQALIAQGAIGTAQIADGSITEAKIVSLNADVITAGTLSVERLLIKGENGLFRAINATDTGLTVEQLSQEEYLSAISGTVLVARSVTADKIAAKTITANEILSGTITAAEINVASLFAAEATVSAIENIILRTETIEALKGDLNLWAEEKISLAVQGKADADDVEEMRTQIDLLDGEIALRVTESQLQEAVGGIEVGGRNLLRYTKEFPTGTGAMEVDVWRLPKSDRTRTEGDDGFAQLNWNVTGLTTGGLIEIHSPVSRLPDGWYGRDIVLSAWLYAADWSTLDDGMYWQVIFTNGSRTMVCKRLQRMILTDGSLHAEAKGEALTDGKWTRLWMTTTLNDTNMNRGDAALLSSCTHVYVSMFPNRNGVFSMKMPKLEFGSTPSDWTPAPEDSENAIETLRTELQLVPGQITAEVSGALANYTPTEVIDGSRLVIQKDRVHIDTPEFEVNVSGTAGDAHFGPGGLAVDIVNSPSVMPRYTGPANLTVGGTVDGVRVFATLTDALAKLSGKFIPAPVTVTVTAGTYTEGRIYMAYTEGAAITVNASGATINGRLYMSGVKCPFTVNGLKLKCANSHTVQLYSCEDVRLVDCDITADKTVNMYYNVVYGSRSNVTLTRTGMYSGYAGLLLENLCSAFVNECVGGNNTYGMFIRNSTQVGYATSYPLGLTTDLYNTADSEYRGSGANAGGTTPSAPEASTEATLALTASRTHDGSGWYSGTNVITQGKTSDGGVYKGCMWFDVSAVSGKTITSATLTMYRNAGVGSGNPVTVRIGTMSNTGASGAVATVTENDVIVGSVDQKEVLTVTNGEVLAAVQQLASGAAKGLYIWGPAASYAQFAGYGSGNAPVITVMYQ